MSRHTDERKDILVRRNQGLGTRAEKRKEVPCNEFFQKAITYEKTIAREGGILMPH